VASYTDITGAQAYFDERLNTDPWDTADDTDKTKALAMATKIIDRLNFVGDKTDEDQELQFPRNDDEEVPDDIVYACCEIALALLDGVDPEIEFENLWMTSQGYGNVRSTYDRSRTGPMHIIHGAPSIVAWRFLSPYLRDPTQISLDRIS
jgi:hypothetical protein